MSNENPKLETITSWRPEMRAGFESDRLQRGSDEMLAEQKAQADAKREASQQRKHEGRRNFIKGMIGGAATLAGAGVIGHETVLLLDRINNQVLATNVFDINSAANGENENQNPKAARLVELYNNTGPGDATQRKIFTDALYQVNKAPKAEQTDILGSLIYHGAHSNDGENLILDVLAYNPRAAGMKFVIDGQNTPVTLRTMLERGIETGNPDYDVKPWPRDGVDNLYAQLPVIQARAESEHPELKEAGRGR